jgi:signal transduction histidine kinase
MIQEEVERADRILTDLMGYAQLSEGRLEKLDVVAELDRAIEQVFPAAANFSVRVERDFAPNLPPLLMQRRHLSVIFLNLLQNAREAIHGSGKVTVTAALRENDSVEVSIADDGPGIPADKIGRIFEPYFTTKDKGTGIGLAIVKHNAGLYSGVVRAESELGKGAKFVLMFPAKTMIAFPHLN